MIKRGLGTLHDEGYRMIGPDLLMAHTRWATHGDKIVDNAHPFEIGRIVGAHNGVLDNHTELNAKYDRKFVVDSMHLFAHLDQGLSFEEIQGYGSIEWFDVTHPDRIYLCRMSSGQLAISGIGKGPADVAGIVWSSDDEHLERALKVAGFRQTFAYKVDEGQVYYVEKGVLYYDDGKMLKLSPRTSRITWDNFDADDAWGNLRSRSSFTTVGDKRERDTTLSTWNGDVPFHLDSWDDADDAWKLDGDDSAEDADERKQRELEEAAIRQWRDRLDELEEAFADSGMDAESLAAFMKGR